MNKLQDEVFAVSKKLISKFNAVRVLIYSLVSVGAVILVLVIIQIPLDIYNISFIIALSLIYSFIRDYSIARYSIKQMDKFYQYLKQKQNNISLYIPILEKNYQGYFLKKAAIYFKDDELYLEAFKQRRSRKDSQDSITVKYGREFSLTLNQLDKQGKVMIFHGFLMDTDYSFSIVNIPEVIDRINKRVKGE
jgi:hypothetical protein